MWERAALLRLYCGASPRNTPSPLQQVTSSSSSPCPVKRTTPVPQPRSSFQRYPTSSGTQPSLQEPVSNRLTASISPNPGMSNPSEKLLFNPSSGGLMNSRSPHTSHAQRTSTASKPSAPPPRPEPSHHPGDTDSGTARADPLLTNAVGGVVPGFFRASART